jgi:PAS domain S-box-containing protein
MSTKATQSDSAIPTAADATAVTDAVAAALTRLHTVIDHAPIVLWAVDQDGRFTLSEGRGLKALGLRPRQVVGMSAFELYAGNADISRALRRALAGEEVEVVFTEGGRTFENRIVPIRHDHDRVAEILGVSIDVTERYQAEAERASLQAQLLQVQKLESLGLLAGGIAHDFNNILTIIECGASTVQLALVAGTPEHQDIENVLAAARRAADLTRQMLAYAGRAHFEIKVVDLSEQLRDMAALLEMSISKKLTLRLNLATALPAIKADVVQLQQITMNLAINAAEAIGAAAGTVTISSGIADIGTDTDALHFVTKDAKPGRYVFMEVQDTGCGMDETTRSKIFDPFFTTKFTGRGLGLAAVLGIVHAHEGLLSVKSALGEGTTFKVYFPVSNGTAHTDAESVSPQSRQGGVALVIDDDDAVRLVTKRVLKLHGFDVLEAENGRRGIEVFGAHADSIGVVILDMTMPDMDGEETFRELKRVRADVRVLLSSGYSEQEAMEPFAGQGLAGFLQKPFNANQLAAKVIAALTAVPDEAS